MSSNSRAADQRQQSWKIFRILGDMWVYKVFCVVVPVSLNAV